ncbi:MAG: HAD hydrolase family protein [Methanomassiliicoccales archaeon]
MSLHTELDGAATRLRSIEAVATDYDRTLTTPDLVLRPETVETVRRARSRGLKVIIVSGRKIDFLQRTSAYFGGLDALVGENGGVVQTASGMKLLSRETGERIAHLLQSKNVPFEKGMVISYVDGEYVEAAREAIKGYPFAKLIMNVGAGMVVPSDVGKEVGLRAALAELGVDESRTVVAGDGENDVSLFDIKGLKVALSNSVQTLKEKADIRMELEGGRGLEAVIDEIIDLRERNNQ